MHEGSGISPDLKILEDLAGPNENEARTLREEDDDRNYYMGT